MKEKSVAHCKMLCLPLLEWWTVSWEFFAFFLKIVQIQFAALRVFSVSSHCPSWLPHSVHSSCNQVNPEQHNQQENVVSIPEDIWLQDKDGLNLHFCWQPALSAHEKALGRLSGRTLGLVYSSSSLFYVVQPPDATEKPAGAASSFLVLFSLSQEQLVQRWMPAKLFVERLAGHTTQGTNYSLTLGLSSPMLWFQKCVCVFTIMERLDSMEDNRISQIPLWIAKLSLLGKTFDLISGRNLASLGMDTAVVCSL